MLIPTVAALLLGATVFHAPIASGADKIMSVVVANDAQHPVPVHHEGTVQVADPRAPGYEPHAERVFTTAPQAGAVKVSPTVPAGKRFIATDIAITVESANSGFPLGDATCAVRFRSADGILGSIIANMPGEKTRVDNYWTGHATTFTPLSAGEELHVICRYTGSQPASTQLSTSVGGYFVPA